MFLLIRMRLCVQKIGDHLPNHTSPSSHVVLAVHSGSSYGALGLSRRQELMYKPLEYKVCMCVCVCVFHNNALLVPLGILLRGNSVVLLVTTPPSSI